MQDLQAQYAQLRTVRDSGKLAPGAFAEEVAKLRIVGSDGAWYQINPENGGWLRWDGKAWQGSPAPTELQASSPASPPDPSQPPAPPAAAVTGALPDGFWPLLGHILKLTFTQLIKQIPMALLFMVPLFIIYFYLVVIKYDGFAKTQAGNPLESMLGLGAGSNWWISGGIFLGILIAFIGTMIKLGIQGKLGAAINSFFSAPAQIGRFFKESGDLAWCGLLGGAGVALFIGGAMNGWASLALAAGLTAILTGPAGQGLALLTRTFWQSIFTAINKKSMRSVPQAAGFVGIAGGMLGLLLNMLLVIVIGWIPIWQGTVIPSINLFVVQLPQVNLQSFLGIVLFIIALSQGLSAMNSTKRPPSPALTGIVLFIVVVGWHSVALAHDGGWRESSGDFWKWLNNGGLPVLIQLILSTLGIPLVPALTTGLTGALTGVSAGGGAGGGGQVSQQPLEAQQQPSSGGDSVMLEGQDSRDWLEHNGLVDSEGRFTEKYRNEWESANDTPFGLHGICHGSLPDPNAPLAGNVVILVDPPPDTSQSGGDSVVDQPDEKKPEEKKPDEPKPEEKKPEKKKPDEPKPDDKNDKGKDGEIDTSGSKEPAEDKQRRKFEEEKELDKKIEQAVQDGEVDTSGSKEPAEDKQRRQFEEQKEHDKKTDKKIEQAVQDGEIDTSESKEPAEDKQRRQFKEEKEHDKEIDKKIEQAVHGGEIDTSGSKAPAEDKQKREFEEETKFHKAMEKLLKDYRTTSKGKTRHIANDWMDKDPIMVFDGLRKLWNIGRDAVTGDEGVTCGDVLEDNARDVERIVKEVYGPGAKVEQWKFYEESSVKKPGESMFRLDRKLDRINSENHVMFKIKVPGKPDVGIRLWDKMRGSKGPLIEKWKTIEDTWRGKINHTRYSDEFRSTKMK